MNYARSACAALSFRLPPFAASGVMSIPAPDRASILVIDDELSVLGEVVETLARNGYHCHSTSEADGAIELAQRLIPDLIISDINLGEFGTSRITSGLELCERIKELPILTEVPVIFLSGASIPDIVRRAHQAGGTYYLRKPFDPEVLLDLVQRALWMPHLVTSQLHS